MSQVKNKIDPIKLISYMMLFLTSIKVISVFATNGQVLRSYIWEFDTSFRNFFYNENNSY